MMLRRVASVFGVLAAVVVLCSAAPASGQTAVWSLTPSSWSALTTATDYTAAQLGVNTVSGTSALGAANKATYYTWAAGEDNTGGQAALRGASAGYIALANNQSIFPTATTDGTVFGGTTGAYTGYAAVTFDVGVFCSDTTALTQTNDSTIFELTVGSSAAFRAQGKLVNHTGVNYPQRKGWKLYGVPTSSVVKVTGFANASTLEPDFELNRLYTVTIYVSANASAGTYALFGDRVMHSRKTGHDTVTGLGAAGNTIAFTSYIDNGYSSGSRLQLRLPPLARVDNSAGWWTAATANPAVAENTGTARVFHTCFTPLATEHEGYPLTVTKVTGTPTITATSYGTTSPCLGRSRFVLSGTSVGDVVRVSSAEALGSLEMTADGDQYVAWAGEYVPTGSAVWGIRASNDASAYAIAVNYSNGLLREGSTVGSGAILCSMLADKVYAVYLTGNGLHTAAEGDRYAARVTVVNQTDDLPRSRLVPSYKLATAWPTGGLGVMSAVYTVGATPMEVSTFHAGRRPGLVLGDSYASTYAYARGTVVIGVTGGSGTPAGTMTETGTGATATVTATSVSGGVGTVTATLTSGSPFQGGGALTFSTTGTGYTGGTVVYSNAIAASRNNVGFHLAHGAENHFLPNGWRPGKPYGSTAVPDLVYAASAARSGRSVEQLRPTTEMIKAASATGGINGFGFIIPGAFGYNSVGSITTANATTTLTTWADEMGELFNAVLSGRNTLVYFGGMTQVAPTGNFSLAGAQSFFSRSTGEVVKRISQPASKPGDAWVYDFYPESSACFVGAGDYIHPSGDTEGPRYIVSRAMGNVHAGPGFATPALRKVAGK